MLSQRNPASTGQWLSFLAVVTSIGWLLPNHYKPWTSFHTESWIGLGLIVFAFQAALRWDRQWLINWPAAVTLIISMIPFTQYQLGVITWSGHAWVSMLYLAAFSVAMLLGSNSSAQQFKEGANTLLLAIGLAASISVGLQLLQWLEVDAFSMWMMYVGRTRPSANFGQPNLLATLQVWGVLSISWWWHQRRIGCKVAFFWAAFLVFGIALTQSRTAWLNFCVLLCLTSVCSHIPKVRQVRNGLLFLTIWLIFSVALISWVNNTYFSNETASLGSRLQESLRPMAWKMFLNATMKSQFVGYGWEQTGQAHLAMLLESPILGVHFGQAHNIFLDIIIWVGLPIGLVINVGIIWFIYKSYSHLESFENFLIFCCLVVVVVHAMLELPLHYAYYLISTGFFAGFLSREFSSAPVIKISRFTVVGFLTFITALYFIIVRDYFLTEARFREMLHEKAHIGTNHPKELPDVWLLDQMRGIVELAYYEPHRGIEPTQIQWAERVTLESPSMANFLKVAMIHGLNDQPDQATSWLRKGCAVLSAQDCTTMQALWNQRAISDVKLIGLFPVDALRDE